MPRPECQDIANQLHDARDELAIAQQDFKEAERNSALKQQLKKEVVRLFNIVQGLERDLRDCEGLPPIPKPIGALFTCTVFVTTSTPIFTPTNTSNVQASMVFSDVDYRLVEFRFPSGTLVGTSTGYVLGATITNAIYARTSQQVVRGTFERSTGHIDMESAVFEVSNSLDFAANGTATFMPLTTRTISSPIGPGGIEIGMPLDRSGTPGRLILVGSSALSGASPPLGFAGTSIDLTIDGVLSAFPPV